MTWTAPMTAVANDIFTASQFNTHIRDNLVETAPAKAQNISGYFVTTGINSITERIPVGSEILTASSESTTSATYGDVTTPGPTVTTVTGSSALVSFGAYLATTASGAASTGLMSLDITGATTQAPQDTRSVSIQAVGAGNSLNLRATRTVLLTDLVPGSNTFTCKYRVTSSGTLAVNERTLSVVPF